MYTFYRVYKLYITPTGDFFSCLTRLCYRMAQVQIGINWKLLTTVNFPFWFESSSSIGQCKASHIWLTKKRKKLDNTRTFSLYAGVSAYLIVGELDSREKVPSSNPDTGLEACRRSASIFKGGLDMFSPRVQEMTVTFKFKIFILRWLKNERNCIIKLSFFFFPITWYQKKYCNKFYVCVSKWTR